jgi:hypothetical protein
MTNTFKLFFRWCELCEAPFISCPKCGNNSCNGTYGKVNGIWCGTCQYIHGFEDAMIEMGNYPFTKKQMNITNKKLLKEITP